MRKKSDKIEKSFFQDPKKFLLTIILITLAVIPIIFLIMVKTNRLALISSKAIGNDIIWGPYVTSSNASAIDGYFNRNTSFYWSADNNFYVYGTGYVAWKKHTDPDNATYWHTYTNMPKDLYYAEIKYTLDFQAVTWGLPDGQYDLKTTLLKRPAINNQYGSAVVATINFDKTKPTLTNPVYMKSATATPIALTSTQTKLFSGDREFISWSATDNFANVRNVYFKWCKIGNLFCNADNPGNSVLINNTKAGYWERTNSGLTASIKYYPTKNLTDGDYYIKIQADDRAGNSQISPSYYRITVKHPVFTTY